MFIEEDAEAFYISKLELATYGDGYTPLLFANYSTQQLDTIADFAKIAPCILVSIYEDSPIKDLDEAGETQVAQYMMSVVYAVPNKYTKVAAAHLAFKMGRVIKGTLRGLVYKTTDGNAEGVSKTYYRGAKEVASEAGILVKEQKYSITTFDR